MDIVTMLAVIALWCGNPSSYRLDSGDVNKCRKEIIKCIDKTPHGWKPDLELYGCIRKQDLN